MKLISFSISFSEVWVQNLRNQLQKFGLMSCKLRGVKRTLPLKTMIRRGVGHKTALVGVRIHNTPDSRPLIAWADSQALGSKETMEILRQFATPLCRNNTFMVVTQLSS